jgi:hypothetical protein
MKNITFSADEGLIRKARERAAADNTTLNEEFRSWLEKYVERPRSGEAFTLLMDRLAYVKPGKSFSRDELNER